MQTQRLCLTRLDRHFLDQLVELDADPAVMRYINGGQPTLRTVYAEKALPRIEQLAQLGEHIGFFALLERGSKRFVGWVHNRPFEQADDEMEVGYRLFQRYWGRGYATEAAHWVLEQNRLFETGAALVAIAMPDNHASIHVMEKLGMQYQHSYRHRTGVDVVKYRMPIGR